jgi:hypothetical protein
MKIKINFETLIYVALIALSLAAVALTSVCYRFTDTKVVYQKF